MFKIVFSLFFENLSFLFLAQKGQFFPTVTFFKSDQGKDKSLTPVFFVGQPGNIIRGTNESRRIQSKVPPNSSLSFTDQKICFLIFEFFWSKSGFQCIPKKITQKNSEKNEKLFFGFFISFCFLSVPQQFRAI